MPSSRRITTRKKGGSLITRTVPVKAFTAKVGKRKKLTAGGD
jgi:hypothetical protein